MGSDIGNIAGCYACPSGMLTMAGCVMPAYAQGSAQTFDYKTYADSYPDLKTAFRYDADALLTHYLIFGKSEGRTAKVTAPLLAPRQTGFSGRLNCYLLSHSTTRHMRNRVFMEEPNAPDDRRRTALSLLFSKLYGITVEAVTDTIQKKGGGERRLKVFLLTVAVYSAIMLVNRIGLKA